MKYKPCCDRRCLVHGCEIREKGGCYCLCRMFDSISSLESVLQGNTILSEGGQIYYPDIEKAKEHFYRLSPEQQEYNKEYRENAQDIIQQIKDKIKEYEVK